MYESKADIKGQFYSMVRAQNLSTEVLVPLAMDDPDLVAFHELRLLGETEAVKPKRAALLEEYDRPTLFSEIKATYDLTESETELVFQGIHARVIEKRLTRDDL